MDYFCLRFLYVSCCAELVCRFAMCILWVFVCVCVSVCVPVSLSRSLSLSLSLCVFVGDVCVLYMCHVFVCIV